MHKRSCLTPVWCGASFETTEVRDAPPDLLLIILIATVVLLWPAPSQAQAVPGKSFFSRILFVPHPDGRLPDPWHGCPVSPFTFDDEWWLGHYGYLFFPYYENGSIARQRQLEILLARRGCPWASEAAEAVSGRQASGVPHIAVLADLPPRREPQVPYQVTWERAHGEGPRPGANDSGGWVGGWSGGDGGYVGPGGSSYGNGGNHVGGSSGAGGGSSGGNASADRGGGSSGGSGDTQAGRPR